MDPTTKQTQRNLECTIRLANLVRDVAFKKRAPRAIREIKRMAARLMSTEQVLIDNQLNAMIWSRGVRYLPRRIRVRFERRLSEDENARSRCYTVVKFVECVDFRGLLPEVVETEE